MFSASGGVLLGALRALLGHLGGFLGPLGAILGRLGAVLSRLETILSRLHALLGPQEAQEGQSVDFSIRFCTFLGPRRVWLGVVDGSGATPGG